MPTYRYQCRKCGRENELFCPISEKSEREKSMLCSCGGRNFEQLFNTRFITSARSESSPESGSSGCGSCSTSSCTGCGRI